MQTLYTVYAQIFIFLMFQFVYLSIRLLMFYRNFSEQARNMIDTFKTYPVRSYTQYKCIIIDSTKIPAVCLHRVLTRYAFPPFYSGVKL